MRPLEPADAVIPNKTRSVRVKPAPTLPNSSTSRSPLPRSVMEIETGDITPGYRAGRDRAQYVVDELALSFLH